jgi:hypothetical protein
MGEAMGLNAALDMAERHNATKIIFELRKASVRKPWGSIVKRCIKFLQDNPNSGISWVNRNKNRVAHELAKWAEIEPNRDWPNLYPNWIHPYIQKDIGSVYSL